MKVTINQILHKYYVYGDIRHGVAIFQIKFWSRYLYSLLNWTILIWIIWDYWLLLEKGAQYCRVTVCFEVIVCGDNHTDFKGTTRFIVPRRYFLCGSFVLFMACVCHAFASVHCCLVVTYWLRANLFVPFVMFNCIFVTLPCGILGQVWYVIVSIPDRCRLSYFTSSTWTYGLLIHCTSKTRFAYHNDIGSSNRYDRRDEFIELQKYHFCCSMFSSYNR